MKKSYIALTLMGLFWMVPVHASSAPLMERIYEEQAERFLVGHAYDAIQREERAERVANRATQAQAKRLAAFKIDRVYDEQAERFLVGHAYDAIQREERAERVASRLEMAKAKVKGRTTGCETCSCGEVI